MRLDFSKLSRPLPKQVGQGGTGGTASIHAGSSCPTSTKSRWDTVGQMDEEAPLGADLSHLSHLDKTEVGQRKPAWIHVVPLVPPVPPQRDEILNASGKIDLVREFMEVDGLTLEEAQALAAVAVQPRAPADWLVLIAELDGLIDRYCAAVGMTDGGRAKIMATRCRQSLASIPESLAWFRRELELIERPAPVPAPAAPTAPAGNYEGRASARAARAKLHQPIKKGQRHD